MIVSKIPQIKDILIDHIFDHCFNEIVQKVESPGFNLTFDDSVPANDNIYKLAMDSGMKSGNFKGYYTTRGKEYCRILIGEYTLQKSLTIKLDILGFKPSKKLFKLIVNAHEQLIASSYIVRNNPLKEEVKLTEKGLRHYLNGKSFQEDFIQRRNSNVALYVSVLSIIIALIALFR